MAAEKDPRAIKAAFDDLPMRIGWDSYRPLTDERLQLIAQTGVEDVLLTPYGKEEYEPALPPGRVWTVSELVQLRNRIEDAGLRLYAIEMLQVALYDVLLADDRDASIALIEETIRNVGRAGIPVLGYSGHHPAGVWRTSRTKRIRGGAQVSAFNHREVTGASLWGDRSYDASELWTAYEAFVERVVPVAEDENVTLGLHPSDPPVEALAGVPLLFRNVEAFDRALAIHPSPNHGLKFGLGCFSEMGVDLDHAIRHFADDLVYVHFRDVVGTVPAFHETFIDDPESNFDPIELMALLQEVGFTGVVEPDHVPRMAGETGPGYGGERGRLFTVGYLKAALDAARTS